MIIDFSTISPKVIPQFYGGEKEIIAQIFTDGRNKILHGTLQPGASIGLHTHSTSSEAIYVLQGRGKALHDGIYEEIHSGLCHYCPKGGSHSLINDSDNDLVFFAVVPEQ